MTPSTPPPTASLVKRYHADPTLTLVQIAREVGLTPATISWRFRKAGVTVERRHRMRPASTVPMSIQTLRFPWPLYLAMQAAVMVQKSTMSDLVRLAFRAEIKAALKRGEIAGPQYDPPIGEAPEDCSIGPTTGQVFPHQRRKFVLHTFTYTARFWRQIKGLAVVRGVSRRALAVDVLTRAMAKTNGTGRRAS